MLVGARWSNDMFPHGLQYAENLFSALALVIGGALAIGLPMALVIIWICS